MDTTPNSALGIEGRFRIVRHDTHGLRGSGPNGEIEFEDLWELDESNHWRSRYPSRVVEDRIAKNKFLRRGLGYFMKTNLAAQSGNDQSKMPPEITYPASGVSAPNPFLAFIMIGDDSGSPTRRGDARVLWSESDGQYDDKIPSGSGSAYYGRRGILISATTGIFKRVQLRYPNSSPNFEEHEYTFFAQANGSAQQTTDVGLDDFVCKSIALANAVACGYNEANSQVGIRAVLGLAATQQGITDRVYVHENFSYGAATAEGQGVQTPLHKFTGVETIANGTPGYVASTEASDTTLLTYASVNITMDNTGGKKITVAGASFVAASHVRKTLTISGMTTPANNQDWTIKRVISSTQVEVFAISGVTMGDEGPTSATAVVKTRNTGDKAFDSRVESEGIVTKATYDADAAGTIIAGEKFASSDIPSPHIIGRVWAKDDQRTLRGIRITFPKGSIRDFCPDKFLVQTLNATHSGGTDPQPAQNADWTTQLDYSGTSQAANIFDNGEYGYEYTFSSPVATCGVRLSGIVPVDSLRKVEIATLYAFEDMASKTITTSSNDSLRLSIDGGVTYKTFTCPAVAATTSVQTICDALNRALYGWGLECLRSTFGYFWIRATVAGSYAQMHTDTVANAIYTTLGLPTSGFPIARTGLTQPLTKAYTDALTIIYTPRMAGNLPKP